jgi:hypothetical protein
MITHERADALAFALSGTTELTTSESTNASSTHAVGGLPTGTYRGNEHETEPFK